MWIHKQNKKVVIFRIALPAVWSIWIVHSPGNFRLGKPVLMAIEIPAILATIYEKAADTLELNSEAALLMSYSWYYNLSALINPVLLIFCHFPLFCMNNLCVPRNAYGLCLVSNPLSDSMKIRLVFLKGETNRRWSGQTASCLIIYKHQFVVWKKTFFCPCKS